MRSELLSPVGNMDMFYQAIHNGADAVYLGGKSFGARAYSNNFTNEEMVWVIRYAHIYGVKVYVTVNTIVFNSEVDEFLDYIKFLYINGVDAVIMQDIGMMDLVHKTMPNLEIHASTQCHNHNDEGIKFLKRLGVTRVVLDREMSLEEINNLSSDIKKEIFIHGALCISYSGCCLFSSLNGNRSGNRGSCVGSCRLPYKLIKDEKEINFKDKYLLSTKELMTVDHFREIMDSNITSLKIEGRMKSPYYVGYITRIYRMLMDKYYNNEQLMITLEEITNIKKLFNRKFTSGYLFNDDIINMESPNHLGVNIGEVIEVNKYKIKIKLSSDLNMGDGIRFKDSADGMIVNKLYNEKGLLVSGLKSGSIALLDNKIDLRINTDVLKTLDSHFNKELENYVEKKISLNYVVKAKKGERLEISLSDGTREVKALGEIVVEAVSRGVSKEELGNKLLKLGNTPYKVDKITYDMDENIFIRMSDLNNLRRELVLKLTELRGKKDRDIIINIQEKKPINYKRDNKVALSFLARNEDQIKCLINLGNFNIYVLDYDLYLRYKDRGCVYYKLPRVINKFNDFKGERLVVTELGSLNKYACCNDVVVEYYLNVVNQESVLLLKRNGVKKIVVSPELDINELEDMDTSILEVVIYGRLEAMVMKYCPIRGILNNCRYCRDDKSKYYLEDKFKNKYPILHNNCLTSIMHYKNTDLIDKIPYFVNIGLVNFKIDLLDENDDDIRKLLERIYNMVML